MKFHNQRSFMGHEISNVNNKPLLHKKGKQWIVVAVSALILAGFGGMVSTTTHADTTATQPTTTNSNTRPTLHLTVAPSSPVIDNLAPHGVSQTSMGKWSNNADSATWNLYANGQLDLHDGEVVGGWPSNLNQSKVQYFNTSNITNKYNLPFGNASAWNIFSGDQHIKDINLSGLPQNWKVSGNWGHGFCDIPNVSDINLGQPDTSSNNYFDTMFANDTNLKSIEGLQYFDTSNTTNMSNMFYNCPQLKSLDLSSFDSTATLRKGNQPDYINGGSHSGNYNIFKGDNSLSLIKLGPNAKFKPDSGIYPFFVEKGHPTTANYAVEIDDGNSYPGTWIPVQGAYGGTWGSATWITDTEGNMAVAKGTLDNHITRNDGHPFDSSNIKSIKFSSVKAPTNSSSLLNKFNFNNVTSLNLSGFDDSQSKYIENILNNSVRTVTLGAHSNLEGPLYAYQDTPNNGETSETDISNDKQTSGTWTIDYVGTMSAEASADAQSAERAANTSASNTFTSASNWVSNNSNSAQSADSWVAKNSQNESNASTEANDANNWISSNSASLSSASASASTNSAWIHNSGVPASTSANNAESWINNNSGSLSNASTAAVEAMTSLNNDSAELNWLANSENVLSSGTSQASSNAQWIKDNSASVRTINSQISSLNTKIFTDKLVLDNAINTKANSTSVSNDEKVLSGTLTHDIDDLSTLNEQAKSLASADENWINANKVNISNNAKNINNNSKSINTNSNTAANGISNDNASASASASIANANADSYALSLANNATDTANVNAGGIDNTINTDDQTVQSLSNTVNTDTESLADNDNNLYQTKADKPAKKQNIKKVNDNLFYFYVIKPMWLHTSAKFTKGNRVKALTAKHGYTLPITRIFKFNGALRFEIKINGTKYFVTGNHYFTRNAYIQPNEIKRNSSIKVLRNIREYKRAGFSKKNFIRNFKRGSVLPIKRAKTIAGKQVTRLQLTNGHWITANKNLVKLI